MLPTVKSRSTAGSSAQWMEVDRSSTTSVPHLSFSGCGFLGIYHVGVASCCKEYAPHLVAQKVAGASAGALVACALITDCCLGECTTFTLNLALQARSRVLGPLSPSFELVRNLRQALDKFLPDDAHEIASGRLHISLTRVSDKHNLLISQFTDKNDLIDALICSSFVPLYSGVFPPKYRGVRYVDGALTDNVPVLDDSTITVSPFAGESDICPNDLSSNLHHISLAGTSIQLTCSNLYRMSVAFFPPSPEILSNMCRQGFDDALRYLQKNKLISCSHHLSIQSAIVSSSPIKFHTSDSERSTARPLDVAMDTDSMETESVCACHDADAEEGEDCESVSECVACDERERFALLDSLPVAVVTALQAACDRVNRGFMARLYKTKAYRAMSLMATPYLLPFEIAYILVRKLYDWAPYMSVDMQWFIKGLYLLLRDTVMSLQSDGDTASAIMERGRILRDWGFTWEMRWGFQLQTMLSSPPTARRRKSSPTSLNVNMGISVDYGPTSGQFDSPLQCVCEARRHVLSSSQHQQARKVSRVAVPSTQPISWSSTTDQCVADCSYDSFDDCIQAADHMDAVLAYYYADEKEAGAVKVVEIFPLHRHPPVSDVTHATVSDVTPPTVADVTPPTVSDHLNASVPDLKDCSLPS